MSLSAVEVGAGGEGFKARFFTYYFNQYWLLADIRFILKKTEAVHFSLLWVAIYEKSAHECPRFISAVGEELVLAAGVSKPFTFLDSGQDGLERMKQAWREEKRLKSPFSYATTPPNG